VYLSLLPDPSFATKLRASTCSIEKDHPIESPTA
jgi:hypothetical protein